MLAPPWLWAVFTIVAAGGQTLRNALQRDLIATAGTVGATHVRFLFGLPFGLLFLVGVRLVTGLPIPTIGWGSLGWILFGGVAQILATALMLAAMRERSFVVTIAYTKTEALQVALFGLVVLGDKVTLGLAAAILIATAGVMIMSWPEKAAPAGEQTVAWRPAILGIVAGGFFALAVVGFRGGVTSLDTPSFVMAATTTLAIGLAMQAAILSAYLLATDRPILVRIFRAWRPSLFAGFMGALASQMWFLAFALQTGARVRTLGLVEMLFAQFVSRRLFSEGVRRHDLIGIGLVVIGVALLMNTT